MMSTSTTVFINKAKSVHKIPHCQLVLFKDIMYFLQWRNEDFSAQKKGHPCRQNALSLKKCIEKYTVY